MVNTEHTTRGNNKKTKENIQANSSTSYLHIYAIILVWTKKKIISYGFST